MSYEFKKLGDVEALEEVPENANALIEVDGAIKRVPGSNLGGGGGGVQVATLNFIHATVDSSGCFVGVCNEMTYEEAYERLTSGQSIAITILTDSGTNIYLSTPTSVSVNTSNGNIYIECSRTNNITWNASSIGYPVV